MAARKVIAFVLAAAVVAAAAVGVVAARGSDSPSVRAATSAKGDEAAIDRCEHLVDGTDVTALAGAFDSTEADVDAWIDAPNRPSGPQGGYPQGIGPSNTSAVSVCFLDGVFPFSRPPPPPGQSDRGPGDRAVVFVKADGTDVWAIFGFRDWLPVGRPSH